jgi:hypothetical protein
LPGRGPSWAAEDEEVQDVPVVHAWRLTFDRAREPAPGTNHLAAGGPIRDDRAECLRLQVEQATHLPPPFERAWNVWPSNGTRIVTPLR